MSWALIRDFFYRFIDSGLWHNRKEVKIALMCLFTSVAFWFLNALNKNYTTKITYPVHFQYDTTRFALKSALPAHIDLQVSGNGWQIFRKQFGNSSPIVFPLTSEKKINPSHWLPLVIKTMPDLRIQSVQIDTLYVKLETARKP
ncbi:MAG: hypothetical protein H7Y04_06055 [Verrucomicrobia bacterium]|nr:hypothetical protein [Cytophagales bacterium]